MCTGGSVSAKELQTQFQQVMSLVSTLGTFSSAYVVMKQTFSPLRNVRNREPTSPHTPLIQHCKNISVILLKALTWENKRDRNGTCRNAVSTPWCGLCCAWQGRAIDQPILAAPWTTATPNLPRHNETGRSPLSAGSRSSSSGAGCFCFRCFRLSPGHGARQGVGGSRLPCTSCSSARPPPGLPRPSKPAFQM